MKKVLIALIRFYQKFISPAFPPSCRYQPTCSNYMIQAIEKHGIKGLLMGIARILRCHPWANGGDDPVPDDFSLRRTHSENKETHESIDWRVFIGSSYRLDQVCGIKSRIIG